MYKTLPNGTKLYVPITKAQLIDLRMQRAARHLIIRKKPAAPAAALYHLQYPDVPVQYCVTHNRKKYIFYLCCHGWVCPITGRIIVTPGLSASTCPNIKQGLYSPVVGNTLFYYVTHHLCPNT